MRLEDEDYILVPARFRGRYDKYSERRISSWGGFLIDFDYDLAILPKGFISSPTSNNFLVRDLETLYTGHSALSYKNINEFLLDWKIEPKYKTLLQLML